HSLGFLADVLDDPGSGTTASAIPSLAPDAVILSLVEGWRGEIVHLAVTDAAGRFAHYKILDPSFRNWFALAFAMRGQPVMDFPLCNKSFNLSYCGHDLYRRAAVMFKTPLARARQGYRTAGFPAEEPGLPALSAGRPGLASRK